MKININTTQPQQMTCDEIEYFVTAHIGGIRHTLEEPIGGYPPPFPLTEDTHLSTTLQMTDGIYTDTLTSLRQQGITVETHKEYIRYGLWEPTFSEWMLSKVTLEGDMLTKQAIEALGSNIPNPNTTVKDLHDLSYFKNLIRCGRWYGASALQQLCIKYLVYASSDSYLVHSCTNVQRAVLPSIQTLYELYNSYNTGSQLSLVDLGPNFATSSTIVNNHIANVTRMVLRGSSVVTVSSIGSTPKYLFVSESLLAEYKSNDIWSTITDKIKPIGGPTWVSEFGSSDPYADLTDEERSWYEDLFPDLYKDWVAPTTD